MSFAYMPFYTGDYYRDTRHLSMLQHGAYRQLIDHCWDQRGPLPKDLERCYRICGAVNKEEQDAVRGIISEFFIEMDDGFYNKRVTDEIRRCAAISGVRTAAGRVGGLAKAAAKNDAVKGAVANAKQMLANAKQMPVSPSPSPSPESSQKNTAPDGVNIQVWQDFQKLRSSQKAPITKTALDGIRREADKAGLSLNQALQLCCERSWRGFKAFWIKESDAERAIPGLL